MNCTKMCLAAGLRPDPLGSYGAPPDSLAVIKGERMEGKERVGNREGGDGIGTREG